MTGIVTACAALLVGGIVLLLMFAGGSDGNKRRRPGNDHRIAKTQHNKTPQPVPPNHKTEPPGKTPLIVNKQPGKKQTKQPALPIARLTDGSGCRWKTGVAPGGRLKAKSLELVKGTAEFTFRDGAVVNVTGPATFALHTSGAMQLTRGRLHAEVPKRAVGFAVVTPTSVIIDLGTKFEVTVDDKGSTDLRVLQGRVEHRRRGADSSSERHRTLKAGDMHHEDAKGSDGQNTTVKTNRHTGPIVVGIKIINGKRYTYSSQAELDRILKKLKIRKP